MGLRKAHETRGRRRFAAGAAALGCVLVSGSIALAGDAGRSILRFERQALEAGEWWRLVSGHFVHLGWSHYLLNAAGLLLISLLFGTALTPPGWLLVAATSIAAIDIGLWIFNPALQWYVGLSGVLHGLLAAAAVAVARSRPQEAAVIILALVVKLAYEQLAGPIPGSEAASGGAVVVAAHLYGSIGGLAGGALAAIRVRPVASL